MSGKRALRAVPDPNGRRTVFYRRVSALMGRGGDQFISPDLQLAAMRDMARRRDLLEVQVVDDIDVSGRTFQRAGIQRVLDLARRRELDVVAVYDLSRLGRNTAESLRVIGELRDLGVAVMSTVEQIDDSPEGQFQLGIWLGLAQLRSDQIARTWRDVHRHRASKGLAHGPAPLGYVRVGGRLEVDEVFAPAVRRVFRDYAHGAAVRSIARSFTATTGRRVELVTVKRMLRNPVYVGQVRLAGETFAGVHEPLVGRELWLRVQRRLERDGLTPSRLLTGENPLAGLVLCAHCHRRMRMHSGRENGVDGPVVRLRCPGKDEVGDCVGPGAPLLAHVEAAIVAKLRTVRGADELDVAGVLERRARAGRARVDASRLRRQRDEMDAALAKLAREWATTGMPATEYQATAAGLRRDRDEVLLALAESERVVDAVPRSGRMAVSSALLDRWDRLTSEEKRRTLLATVRVATFRQATRWREPVADRLDVDLI